MAVYLNSVLDFHSTLQGNYSHLSRSASWQKVVHMPSIRGLRRCTPVTRQNFFVLVAKNGRLENEVSDKDSKNADIYSSEAVAPTENPSSSEVQEESIVSQEEASKPSLKRSPLTAREKLRAARVLSRYNESKVSSKKPELGRNLLEALRESDKGKKRPGLPEAPTNLFDDSKRGMPKPGWTFEFPGGFDVFLVVLSFVLISTIMFATTYVVWKVGAIHFNEY